MPFDRSGVPPITDELLARYLSGDVAITERIAVERWAGADLANARQLADLQSVWRARDPRRYDVEAGISAILRRASAPSTAVPPARLAGRASFASSRGRRPIRVAAAAAAAALIYLGVTLAVGHRGFITARSGREYATTAGQQLRVTLMDGTAMILAPGSRIRMSAHYGRGDRRTELQGEAYFAVAHDPRHPFSVRVGDAVITDIGTAFDARGYPGDPSVRVAVAAGEVSLAQPTRQATPVMMTPGDVALASAAGLTVTHRSDIATITAWTQGRLVFEDASLREVIGTLSRTFDLDISIADSALLSRRVTASFSQEPVDEILAAVVLPLGAEAQRTGRKVVIDRRPPTARRRVAAPLAQSVVELDPAAAVRAQSPRLP